MFVVVALQAVQEEIESLRRDINILKKVVAEKEQEMLSNGADQTSMKQHNNTNGNNNNANAHTKKTAEDMVVYLL